jgi:hypothetical protein
MNQTTFWDGDEKKEMAPERPQPFEPSHKEASVEAKPKKDYRIKAPTPYAPQSHQNARGDPFTGDPLSLPAPITAEFMAAQLLKLWKAGILRGADDPEIMFYCLLIRCMEAEVVDNMLEQEPFTKPRGPKQNVLS